MLKLCLDCCYPMPICLLLWVVVIPLLLFVQDVGNDRHWIPVLFNIIWVVMTIGDKIFPT